MALPALSMRLEVVGAPLVPVEGPVPSPGPDEVLIEVTACGVCRTDLHVIDGEVPANLPIVPGHEIVGRVVAIGEDVDGHTLGDRLGVPWLGGTCGVCRYCAEDRENLCDRPTFTGATRDGGFSTHLVADARYCLPLPPGLSDVEAAPLLCAGLIGYRSLVAAGPGEALGIYGFGAAAHIIAQVAIWQGRRVHAFTRAGDERSQAFARSLGCWAGASVDKPPEELDAAIIFAPAGELVPIALRAVRKGGRIVCGGIHMSDIPSFPYESLWGERSLVSVANLTRRDGREFMALAAEAPIRMSTSIVPLRLANEAIERLRRGEVDGAVVLTPS